MGRVIESQFKRDFLILLVSVMNEPLCLQSDSFQNDLLWGFLVIDGKKIGEGFG